MIRKNEKDIKRLKQTVLATVKEDIGDKIDSLIECVKSIESNMKQDNVASSDETLRKRRIILKNLDERENENSKQRVESILNYLMLANIHVVNAERKNSKNIAKPGIVIATLRSIEDKAQVLSATNALRHSSRYKHIYIEPDIPGYHRKFTSNLHTIVNTLGKEKLHIKGSRVYVSEQEVKNSRQTYDSGNRNDKRPTISTRNGRGNYDRGYEHDQYNRRYGDRGRDRDYYSRGYKHDDEHYNRRNRDYEQRRPIYYDSRRNYSDSVRPKDIHNY